MPPFTASEGERTWPLSREVMVNDMIAREGFEILKKVDWPSKMNTLYESLDHETLLNFAIETLENSVAFCAISAPRNVIVVDTPVHENIERQNTLTIVISGAFSVRLPGKLDYRIRDYVSFSAYQYSPNWNELLDFFHQTEKGIKHPPYWYLTKDGRHSRANRLQSTARRLAVTDDLHPLSADDYSPEKIKGLLHEALTGNIELRIFSSEKKEH